MTAFLAHLRSLPSKNGVKRAPVDSSARQWTGVGSGDGDTCNERRWEPFVGPSEPNLNQKEGGQSNKDHSEV